MIEDYEKAKNRNFCMALASKVLAEFDRMIVCHSPSKEYKINLRKCIEGDKIVFCAVNDKEKGDLEFKVTDCYISPAHYTSFVVRIANWLDLEI